MKLDARTEIKYDATGGTVTRFLVILDGEPTMQVLCDMADQDKVIRIAKAGVDSAALTQDTNGRFTTYAKLLEDADGSPLGAETRVDRKSVYGYIVPRLHLMLGRLLRAAG